MYFIIFQAKHRETLLHFQKLLTMSSFSKVDIGESFIIWHAQWKLRAGNVYYPAKVGEIEFFAIGMRLFLWRRINKIKCVYAKQNSFFLLIHFEEWKVMKNSVKTCVEGVAFIPKRKSSINKTEERVIYPLRARKFYNGCCLVLVLN